jgi:tripeptidyl-peptidase-1
MRSLLIAFASCMALAIGTQTQPRVIFPAAFKPPPSMRRRDARIKNDQTLQVDIALSLDKTRISDAERALMEVSNPASPKFGHHLTAEEVAELFTPDKQGIHEVVKWLASSVPLDSIRSSANGHIYVNTTVALAETLFQTQYSEFITGENTTHAVFHNYSLPVSVSGYVDYIIPAPHKQESSSSRPDLHTPDHNHVNLEGLSQKVKLRDAAVRNINCFQYMTPHCLRALYNIPGNLNGSAHPNNSMGFYTPAWSTWLAEDMDAFFTDFEPELVGARPVIENIDGGYRQTDVKLSPFNLEANLDFQYSMSLAYPLPIIDLQVSRNF